MKIFKIVQLLSLGIYTVVYLLWSFVMWDFYNPIQWIIDIPTYNASERGEIVFWVFFYYLGILRISVGIHERVNTN